MPEWGSEGRDVSLKEEWRDNVLALFAWNERNLEIFSVLFSFFHRLVIYHQLTLVVLENAQSCSGGCHSCSFSCQPWLCDRIVDACSLFLSTSQPCIFITQQRRDQGISTSFRWVPSTLSLIPFSWWTFVSPLSYDLMSSRSVVITCPNTKLRTFWPYPSILTLHDSVPKPEFC